MLFTELKPLSQEVEFIDSFLICKVNVLPFRALFQVECGYKESNNVWKVRESSEIWPGDATTSICILRDIIVHCKCQRKFIYTERLWFLTRSKLGEWSQEQITWKGLFLLKHSLAITFFQTLHLKNLPEIQDGRHKWPADITTSLKIDLSDYYKPPLTMENTIAKECLFPWIFGFPGVTQCL